MADDKERERGAGQRRALERPATAGGEKALGLEVARLFGISPRLLMTPASPPADRSAEADPPDTSLEGEPDREG